MIIRLLCKLNTCHQSHVHTDVFLLRTRVRCVETCSNASNSLLKLFTKAFSTAHAMMAKNRRHEAIYLWPAAVS